MRLTHLAVIECFKIMHPFGAVDVDSLWFSNFSRTVLHTSVGRHLVCVKKFFYSTAGFLVAKYWDIKEGRNQNSVLSQLTVRLFNAFHQLDKARGYCCCAAYADCDLKFGPLSCDNFFNDFHRKFHKFNEHRSEGLCCCDGYFKDSCLHHDYIVFRRFVHEHIDK